MKSILVIGMGRFGRHLANTLQRLGNEVMVVDKDQALIDQLSASFSDSYIGDCTNSAVIKAIGADSFDICFVTIGEDFQSSLVITSLLKKSGARFVVSKANQDIQAEILTQIGADEVVYPERDFAEKLAIRYNANNIFDFIQVTDEYSICEIPILPGWNGKSVEEVNVRSRYKINIIAVKKGNSLVTLPGAGYVFNRDEHLVVIGKSTDVMKLTSN